MADDDNEETGGRFVIDGEEYPFPLLYEGFTMDEAMAFFSYTGFPLEDLIGGDLGDLDEEERADLEMKARNPKTLAGLMHIAYTRGNAGAKEASVRKLVRSLDFATALSKFVATEDASAVPPTEPQRSEQPTPSSDERSPETSEPSGDASTTSSDQPGDDPDRIGTTGSGTSGTFPPIRAVG